MSVTYFGEPWNGMVKQDLVQVKTPVKEKCNSCHKPIMQGDQGVVKDDYDEFHLSGEYPTHLDCWLEYIRGISERLYKLWMRETIKPAAAKPEPPRTRATATRSRR